MTDIFTSTENEFSFKEPELVYKTYLLCNLQQRALETIVKNVLSAEMRWVHDRNKSMTVADEPISKFSTEYNVIRRFLKDIILQIKLFGYVIYRMSKTEGELEDVKLEVANGSCSMICFNTRKNAWEVKCVNGTAVKRNVTW